MIPDKFEQNGKFSLKEVWLSPKDVKKIIDYGCKKACNNALNERESELHPDDVERKVKDIFSEIFRSLEFENKGFYLMEYNAFFNEYFSQKFNDIQSSFQERYNIILNKELEEERKDQEVFEYINDFFKRFSK